MSSAPPPLFRSGFAEEGLDSFESAVRHFEALWAQGQRPALEGLLPHDPAQRLPLLIELVHVELELRLKAGEPARVEEYLERFPELAGEAAVVRELLVAEYAQRARREPNLSAAEYVGRFPHWQAQLEQALAPAPPGDGSPASAVTRYATLVCSAPVPSARWPAIPGYEILGELGRGGMGVVYKAWQLSLKRVVALKVVRAGAGPEDLARFRTEAEAAARLRHPGIVPIHEVGEAAGQPYLTLEYVEGGSLSKRLDGTPWQGRRAAALVRALAEAVQHAHQQGVVHRDLKPGNVLLDGEGRARVSDFGLAKLLQGGSDEHTRTGAVLGTPCYMSPEQASGRAHETGPATDVHALGVLLYELLTGRPPFRGESAEETMQLVRAGDPVPPRRLHPQVGRDLEVICLKCLRKAPADRYASAADLAADLDRFEAGQPIRARPLSVARRVAAWGRRRPAAATLAVSGALLLATVLAGLSWHTQRLAVALDKAAASERRAWQSEYALQMRLAQQSFGLGDPFGLSDLLDRYRPAAGAEDRRAFEWWYLSAHRQPPVRAWPTDVRQITWLAYSPDGRRLATIGQGGREAGRLKAWDARTRELLLDVPAEASPGMGPTAAFGGAGEWLAVVTDRAVTRWHVRTRRPLGQRLEHPQPVRAVAVSAGDRQLITGGDEAITVWDLATETPAVKFPPAVMGTNRLCLSADGRTVASVSYGGPLAGRVQLWDVPSGRAFPLAAPAIGSHPLVGGTAGAWFASVDLDGRPVFVGAAVEERGRFRVADGRGVPYPLWDDREAATITALALSPDGRTLAVGGMDGAVRFWDVPSRARRALLRWQGNGVTCLAFSPDGKSLAGGTRDGMVFQTAVPGWHAPDTLRPALAPYRELACSPDGKTLAVADRDRTVKLLDLATGRVRIALEGLDNLTHALAFSPDGTTLAAVAEHDGVVLLWDTKTGRRRRRLVIPGACSIAFAPRAASLPASERSGEEEGGRLFAIGASGAVHLFDQKGCVRRAVLPSQNPAVAALAFAPGGRTLVSAGTGGVLEAWDVVAGRTPQAPRHRKHRGRAVNCAAFHPDGRTLLTGDEGAYVCFWDVTETALAEGQAPLRVAPPVCSLQCARDGRTVLTYGPGQDVRLWDLKTRKVRKQLRHYHPEPDAVGRAVLVPDGAGLAVIDPDGRLEVWDRKTWTRTLPAGPPLSPVRTLLFTPGAPAAQALLTVCENPERRGREVFGSLVYDVRAQQRPAATLRFWDPVTGAEQPGLEGPLMMAPPELAALSPDGRLLAAGGPDGRVLLWDRHAGRLLPHRLVVSARAAEYAATFDKIRPLNIGDPTYPDGLRSVAFSPDGRLLVTAGSQGAVRLWAAADWQEVRCLDLNPAGPVWTTFAPNGDLVVPRGGQVEFLDLREAGGAARLRLGSPEDPAAVGVAFSPAGDLIAVAHADRRIRLWDVARRQPVGTLLGHMDRITALAFSPDGKTLASGSHDRTVRLWSVAAASAVASLEQHRGRVYCLAFSADGATLASGGEGPRGQGEVYLWRAPRR